MIGRSLRRVFQAVCWVVVAVASAPAESARVADDKADAAKIGALEVAFKASSKPAEALAARKAAVAGVRGLGGLRLAKALLAAHGQCAKEFEAHNKEFTEGSEKASDLLGRKKSAKPDDAKKLEKLNGSLKEVSGRMRELGGLMAELERVMAAQSEPDSLTWLLANAIGNPGLSPALRRDVCCNASACEPPLVAALGTALTKARDAADLAAVVQGIGGAGVAAYGMARTLVDLLENADAEVRAQSAYALARIGSPLAIAPLVHRIGVEELVARRRVAVALRLLTGQTFGTDSGVWNAWVTREGATLASGAEALPSHGIRKIPRLFGLPLEGRTFIFVIDCSAGMLERFDKSEGATDTRTRLDVAKATLHDLLPTLPPGTRFGLLAYAHEARTWAKRLTVVTPESVAGAQEWLGKLSTAAGTIANTTDALMRAFDFADGGADGPKIAERIDALVLITASRPQRADQQPDSAALVRSAVELRNRATEAIIHTVALGTDTDLGMLQSLASENGGRFTAQ